MCFFSGGGESVPVALAYQNMVYKNSKNDLVMKMWDWTYDLFIEGKEKSSVPDIPWFKDLTMRALGKFKLAQFRRVVDYDITFQRNKNWKAILCIWASLNLYDFHCYIARMIIGC